MKALNIFQINISKHLRFMYQFRKNTVLEVFSELFCIKSNKYKTRSSGNFYKPFYKTNIARFALSYRGPHIWNTFASNNPHIVQAETYQRYKTLVKDMLLNFKTDITSLF